MRIITKIYYLLGIKRCVFREKYWLKARKLWGFLGILLLEKRLVSMINKRVDDLWKNKQRANL